ncbi:MAG: formylmethanofuran dehydrogenase subunit E family protein [Syntrophales bacterium]|nr:formylmethanofuran dehydrogenase subunit E family protein [Syntrophales bacterium]
MKELNGFSFEEYLKIVRSFHGHLTPELILGCFMVRLALENFYGSEPYYVICETPYYLPDAIQILTHCTIGNGMMKIIDLGRLAVTFYDRKKGEGIRVFIDTSKISNWPEIYNWYTGKREKIKIPESLIQELVTAGASILGLHPVSLKKEYRTEHFSDIFSICPSCREAYPAKDGAQCRACQGNSPYE